MSELIKISFREVDIYEKEIISFHIPHSKKLNDDHKYFDKRIIWRLIKRIDTEDYPYEAIEEDEKNGIRYQERFEQIISEINGITNDVIREKINLENCFKFLYRPNELDKLFIESDYKYKEIKAINQPFNRGLEYISLTYKKGIWEIDREVEKRIVKKATTGIVKIKRTHNTV